MISTSHILRATSVSAAALLVLSACSDNGNGDGGGNEADGETYDIGITQIVSHPALDSAREGFKDAFDDADVDVNWDEQNAQGEQATASNIAGTFAAAGLDLVHSIATPTSQAAAQQITDAPIVFSSVTDPVDAGLVESWEEPGGNITGASDMNPVSEQLELLLEIVPDVETVGVVYSSGETNSAVQVELLQEAAEELGVEVQTATISASSEVQQGVESLSGVDAIYVPTDNAVVSALESVIQYGQQNEVPILAAEADSVTRGAMATYGIDYYQLGYQAGEMALRILVDGEDPATMAVETQENLELTVNPEAADMFGVEISEELIERADVVVGEDVEAQDPADADDSEEESDEDADEDDDDA